MLNATPTEIQSFIDYLKFEKRYSNHTIISYGNDLSSLSNNLIVVQILEAAKQSAKEGRKIVL